MCNLLVAVRRLKRKAFSFSLVMFLSTRSLSTLRIRLRCAFAVKATQHWTSPFRELLSIQTLASPTTPCSRNRDWQHKFKIHTVIRMNFVKNITANLYKRHQRSTQLRHRHSVSLCTDRVIQHNELTADTQKAQREGADALAPSHNLMVVAGGV